MAKRHNNSDPSDNPKGANAKGAKPADDRVTQANSTDAKSADLDSEAADPAAVGSEGADSAGAGSQGAGSQGASAVSRHPDGPRPNHPVNAAADIATALDLAPLLAGWEYEPGTINVRKVPGIDGRDKLQMRLELGILQMETTGRPDGTRPHDCDSALEYQEHRLADYRAANNDLSDGFALSRDDCRELRDEAALYYQRYLSLYALAEYEGVMRDTARNLRVLDLCSKYARRRHDRLLLEQYRPYIIMMGTRAATQIQLRRKNFSEALQLVRAGLGRIKKFFIGFGQPEAYDACDEVRALKRLGRSIRRRLPVDPRELLERKLRKAVKAEDYELAARLRDELAAMVTQP